MTLVHLNKSYMNYFIVPVALKMKKKTFFFVFNQLFVKSNFSKKDLLVVMITLTPTPKMILS